MKRAILCGALLAVGCGSESDGSTPTSSVTADVRDLLLTRVSPATLLPGSRLRAEGQYGTDAIDFRLELDGTFDGTAVSLSQPLTRDDEGLGADWPGASLAGLPGEEGRFEGTARVVAADAVSSTLTHSSSAISTQLDFKAQLLPSLDVVAGGPVFPNDDIEFEGAGVLLGGNEGQTIASVSGCIERGGSCDDISPEEMVVLPNADRSGGTFRWYPRLTGISPGTFRGRVALFNRVEGSASSKTTELDLELQLLAPRVFEFSPTAASLGQLVDVSGGGFVGTPSADGDETPAATTIELDGNFTAPGLPAIPAFLRLVPQFETGRKLRYVVSEDDELGGLANLRTVTGTFEGNATPVTRYGSEELRGDPATVTLSILPVRQVVWVRFLDGFIASLERFGLRAADSRVRERVLAVTARDFAGINLELRLDEPDDWASYSTVEVSGPDPNGLGLFGYDNSPGKDTNNLRLYDRIGGVNALTQEDGFPGYGGVFVESLFGFSEHPPPGVATLELATATFDGLFDAFRPDLGGSPVLAADFISRDLPDVAEGRSCPAASDRPSQVSCAIWALGSLVGTTLSHEIAHSLGLADPDGEEFHNSGDAPSRLMDGGAGRPFVERAQVDGAAPGMFCAANYEYLRTILPSSDPDPVASRPSCD